MDHLGSSYLEGVTVKVSDSLTVSTDLSSVEHLLSMPTPTVLSGEINYDITLEKRVLADLEERRIKKEEDEKKKLQRIEAYEQKKREEKERKRKEDEEKALQDERIRLEEIEKKRKAEEEAAEAEQIRNTEQALQAKKLEEEAEWKKFEEERFNSVNGDGETVSKPEDDCEEFKTPPQEIAVEESEPNPIRIANPQIEVRGKQSSSVGKVNINFSDFEALSDPFADLELKTINDLQELQTILTTNTMTTPSSQPQGLYNYIPPAPGSAPAHNQPFSYQSSPGPVQAGPQAQAFSTGYSYTSPGYSLVRPPPYPQHTQPFPSSLTGHQHTQSYLRREAGETGARSVSSDRGRLGQTNSRREESCDGPKGEAEGTVKPSRSVGDIIGELQREQRVMEEHKRKSVGSPTPTPPALASGLENWVGWPTLEGRGRPEELSCLAGLSQEEVATCRQLQEMGFTLSRLARGCKAVGCEQGRLLNFCLVVGRLCEEGAAPALAEEVAALHNGEEEGSKRHLKAFKQLQEIGFPEKEVHSAIIAASFDHEKALEQLIK